MEGLVDSFVGNFAEEFDVAVVAPGMLAAVVGKFEEEVDKFVEKVGKFAEVVGKRELLVAEVGKLIEEVEYRQQILEMDSHHF